MVNINLNLNGKDQLLLAGKFLTDLANTVEGVSAPVVEAKPEKKAKRVEPVKEAEPVKEVAEPVKEVAEPVKEVAEPVKEAVEPVENKADLEAKLQECREGFQKKKSPENAKKAKSKLLELGAENISTLPTIEAANEFLTFLSTL